MAKNKASRVQVYGGVIVDTVTWDQITLEGDVFRQLGLIVAFLTSRDVKRVTIDTAYEPVTYNYLAHLLKAAGFKVKVLDDQ